MIEPNPMYINARSEEIDLENDSLEVLFGQLEAELGNSEIKGIGLSAVQIGVLKRAAIVRTSTTTLNIWNPEIVDREERMVSPEGCLSLPGVNKSVPRYREIVLKNGDGRQYVLSGLDALVVQHEIDHMDGITICDKTYASLKVGRNEKCPCGSGKKFKKCHIDQEVELQQLLITGDKK